MSDRPEWVVNSFREGRWQLTVGKSKYKEGSLIYSIKMGKRDKESETGWTSVYFKGISKKSLTDLIAMLEKFKSWDTEVNGSD